MARTLTANMTTEVTGDSLSPIVLCKFEFDSGDLLLWSGYGEITWDSQTWTGSGLLLSMSPMEETSEIRASGTSFVLSGQTAAMVSLALSEEFQGRAATVWFGALDSSGAVIGDPVEIFKGFMDVMTFDRDGDRFTIQLACENELIDLERPKKRHYTPEDQAIDYSGDKGFEFVASLQESEIVWGK